MNNKTRRLQAFMRALSASDLQGSLVRNVETEMARIDVERQAVAQHARGRAASRPEMAKD